MLKSLKLADDLALPADEAVTQKLKERIRNGSPPDAEGCWIWQASLRNGYGQTSVGGVNTYTHRLSYQLFNGPIPDGMRVCHKCDVNRCNNPEHLFLGTQAENLADMREKGRASKPPIARGETHHATPLKDSDVVQIRELARRGVPQRAIAARFGCCQATVSSIVRGEYRKEAR